MALGLGGARFLQITAAAPPDTVLVVGNDFEALSTGERVIEHWRFTQEQKDANYAVIRRSSDAFSGKAALELTLNEKFPFVGDNSIEICPIIEGMSGGRGDYFLPPETDAIRLRIKVLEGEFRCFVTAETIFLSNLGNVHCSDQTFRPTKNGEWQTVDFPLYKTLSRDFYAYSYLLNPKAPVYFSRLNQHCPKLVFSMGSHGKVLIDKIELVNYGMSKPYPVFKKEDVKTIAAIADFEDERDMAASFTVYMTERKEALNGPVPADFKGKKKDSAAILTRLTDPIRGSHVLEYSKQFHEEKSYVGFRLPQTTDANAFAMKLYMEHLSGDKRTILPFDFIVFAAPDAATAAQFPFAKFASPAEWKKDADFGYDYYLPKGLLANTSVAFYQVRRGIRHKEWNDVVIPFADLVCVYGTGSMEDDYLTQKPIRPENIFAVLLVTPHYPLGYAQTRHRIDDVRMVKVPGTDEQLRSYWQMSPEMIRKITFVRDPRFNHRGGVLHQVVE
jgi:hypothetical protein